MFFRTNKVQSEHWLLLIKQTSQLHHLLHTIFLLQPVTAGYLNRKCKNSSVKKSKESCPLRELSTFEKVTKVYLAVVQETVQSQPSRIIHRLNHVDIITVQ